MKTLYLTVVAAEDVPQTIWDDVLTYLPYHVLHASAAMAVAESIGLPLRKAGAAGHAIYRNPDTGEKFHQVLTADKLYLWRYQTHLPARWLRFRARVVWDEDDIAASVGTAERGVTEVWTADCRALTPIDDTIRRDISRYCD